MIEMRFPTLEGFTLEEGEAASFLKAAKNVARHYSIETTQKTLDWIAFVGISAQVFGTRGVALAMQARAAARPPAPRGATLHPIRGGRDAPPGGAGATSSGDAMAAMAGLGPAEFGEAGESGF